MRKLIEMEGLILHHSILRIHLLQSETIINGTKYYVIVALVSSKPAIELKLYVKKMEV